MQRLIKPAVRKRPSETGALLVHRTKKTALAGGGERHHEEAQMKVKNIKIFKELSVPNFRIRDCR